MSWKIVPHQVVLSVRISYFSISSYLADPILNFPLISEVLSEEMYYETQPKSIYFHMIIDNNGMELSDRLLSQVKDIVIGNYQNVIRDIYFLWNAELFSN